jgi:hypothetical protein
METVRNKAGRPNMWFDPELPYLSHSNFYRPDSNVSSMSHCFKNPEIVFGCSARIFQM